MLENLRLVPELEKKKGEELEGEELEGEELEGEELEGEELEGEELEDKELEGEELEELEGELKMKHGAEILIPAARKDTFNAVKGIPIPGELKEEKKNDATHQKDKYKKESSKTWIEEFMTNNNYSITDNEANGDCLFATIRDAFSQIAQQTSVPKLRQKLSIEANDDVFMGYKNQYNMAATSVKKDTEMIKELEIQYKKFQDLYNGTIDRNEKKKYVTAGDEIRERIARMSSEKQVSQLLMNEFKFMKNIDTLEKFKEKIRTCEFWGETWAISTLERILNIKFILMSSEAYKAKDIANVLNCGQLNDVLLQSRGEFTPEFYIILDYTGDHYKLIGYKKKKIFTFNELPYDVKKLVVDKCMERNAGLFSLIPDFVRFKKHLSGGIEPVVPQFEELSESKIKGLYDDNIEFVFYKSSASKPLPGKGSGEKIEPLELVKEFAALRAVPEWRRKLDIFWVDLEHPFMLGGRRWASVEHYYQANKYKQNNPEFYMSFTLESGTPLSKDPEMAKAAGSGSGKFKGESLRPEEVKADSDFKGKRAEKVVYDAQYAKFNQNVELKKMLIETKNAKLAHYKKGKEPELAEDLMSIREKLRPKVSPL
jgi:predicted NAD-dependent protein-ADP-ribosyltransferase YbiA (DUF1768 family)